MLSHLTLSVLRRYHRLLLSLSLHRRRHTQGRLHHHQHYHHHHRRRRCRHHHDDNQTFTTSTIHPNHNKDIDYHSLPSRCQKCHRLVAFRFRFDHHLFLPRHRRCRRRRRRRPLLLLKANRRKHEGDINRNHDDILDMRHQRSRHHQIYLQHQWCIHHRLHR
jgi:hypothetical protein